MTKVFVEQHLALLRSAKQSTVQYSTVLYSSNLCPVSQQGLHHRGLARLYSQVQGGVVVLRTHCTVE